jgi:hypothetical protein
MVKSHWVFHPRIAPHSQDYVDLFVKPEAFRTCQAWHVVLTIQKENIRHLCIFRDIQKNICHLCILIYNIYNIYIYRYWPGVQSNFSSYFPFDSVNRPSKFSNMDQRASFPHRHPSLEPSIVIRHIPSNKSLHPIYRISHYIYIYIYIYISQYMNIITYNCVPLYLIISSYIPNLPPASSSYILFPIVFPMIFPIIFPFIIFPYYCSRKEYSEYSQYYGWLSVFPIQFYSIYIYTCIYMYMYIHSFILCMIRHELLRPFFPMEYRRPSR